MIKEYKLGLSIVATGLNEDEAYDCGYIAFTRFRIDLAKAYNEEMGKIYERAVMPFSKPIDGDEKRYKELCNKDLDAFLWHSDCDGSLTYKECRKIYNVIKELKMSMHGSNYGNERQYNTLERWKDMFLHCAKHRVNMYFR